MSSRTRGSAISVATRKRKGSQCERVVCRAILRISATPAHQLSSPHNQQFPAEPGVPVPIGETVASAAAADSAVVALVHHCNAGRR
jgi:hypothetical protein